MNPRDAQVMVVGAGIAGLALARTLRQRQITTVVVDRAVGPQDAGLALNLPGNAVRALSLVGVGDDIESIGEPVRRREYRSANDRIVFAIDEDAFWGDVGRSRCVLRRDLFELLVSDLPADTVRWGSAVTSARTTGEGVEVVLADGAIERCALLIGADGVHSTVRSAVFGDSAPRSALLSAASWRFMALNPGVHCWTAWTGKLATFLLIPVDSDTVYGFGSATRGGPVDADPEWLRSAFGDFPPPVQDVVGEVLDDRSTLYHSPLEEVRVPHWTHDRVILIGDAAHATTPVWAQGAAMAVEDAVVLAELIATHDDWSRIGPQYERRRRPRIGHVQAMTDRLSRAAKLPGWIRNTIYPFVGPRTYRETYGPLKTAP